MSPRAWWGFSQDADPGNYTSIHGLGLQNGHCRHVTFRRSFDQWISFHPFPFCPASIFIMAHRSNRTQPCFGVTERIPPIGRSIGRWWRAMQRCAAAARTLLIRVLPRCHSDGRRYWTIACSHLQLIPSRLGSHILSHHHYNPTPQARPLQRRHDRSTQWLKPTPSPAPSAWQLTIKHVWKPVTIATVD